MKPAVTARTHLLLSGLFGVLFVLLFLFWAKYGVPHEDAAILFRYSQNLADTGVITYNPGDEPVEGATAFLWMGVLAAGLAIGIPPFYLALGLSGLAVAGLAWIGSKLTGTTFTAWLMLILVSPPLVAALGGFSGIVAGLVWGVTLFAWEERKFWLFASMALVGCLLRPDFALYLFGLGLAYNTSNYLGIPQVKRLAFPFLMGFLLPGAAYFLWRWQYFGLALPLPFYVKTASAGYQFLQTFYLLRLLGVLLLPILIMSFLNAKRQIFSRESLSFLMGMVIFPALVLGWFTLEQNIGLRHYFFIILAAVIWLFRYAWPQRKALQKAGLVWLVLVLAFYGVREAQFSWQLRQSTTIILGKQMSQWPEKGRLAVTEAGYLPYYSGWETLDLWGLNTPSFSKKAPTPADLQSWMPVLILVDDPRIQPDSNFEAWPFMQDFSQLSALKTWASVCDNAYAYALENGQYSFWLLPRYQSREGMSPQFFERPYFVMVDQNDPGSLALTGLLRALKAQKIDLVENLED